MGVEGVLGWVAGVVAGVESLSDWSLGSSKGLQCGKV